MKIKISDKIIKFAYKFVDVEASASAAIADERMIEYSFALSKIVSCMQKGVIYRILDVGCTAKMNPIPATLCELGNKVWGIDRRAFQYKHSNFHFVFSDIRNTTFADNYFDFICAISTLEHIGISGRYGINKKDVLGDSVALWEINRILKNSGKLIVTIPYGNTAKQNNLGRVYDSISIADMFKQWNILTKLYYSHSNDFCLPSSIACDNTSLVVMELQKK